LPNKVTKGTGSLEYIYDAMGNKLAKKLNNAVVNYYAGSIVYKGTVNKEPEYILHPEGIALYGGTSFAYQYNLTDHLGNVRSVLATNKAVEQTTDYFPFGLAHATANLGKNKYLYNGKELQNDNVGGTAFNNLDYGARFYDPTIARWNVIDPLAEKYYGLSPYNYCGNNPINRIDPTGMDWYQSNKTKYYSWYDGEEEREGYSRIGGKGSVLGEFESIIDGVLTDSKGFNTRSLYSEGFTFDIAPNDKGGAVGSIERDWARIFCIVI